MKVLEVAGLSKNFIIRKTEPGLMAALKGLFYSKKTKVQAVNNINFSINQNEMVGLIGPNGAGKSTTIKMITGILQPSAGSINLYGLNPVKQRKQCALRYGVVFGQRSQLWWHLPLGESFKILEKIYMLEPADAKKTRENLIEIFNLSDFLQTPVRKLSLGQRTRANIAASLLHQPEILFLDEPTIGVDVVGKTRLREFVKQVNQEFGITVIITSHDMIDIERLCKRVIIIDHGTIVYDGNLQELREKVVTERTLVIDLAQEAPHVLLKKARLISQEYNRLTLSFEIKKFSTNEILEEISTQFAIRDFSISDPSIDEVISYIYEKDIFHEAAEC